MRWRRLLAWWPFVLLGVMAAVVGMAAGHLVAGWVEPAASPVLAVGSNVIDATPTPVKEWAVRRFSTNDKPILLGTVSIVAVVLAAAAGVLARRRLWAGLAVTAFLGVLAIVAALRSPASSSVGTVPGATVLPGLVALVVASTALWWLRSLLVAPRTEDRPRSVAATDGSATALIAAPLAASSADGPRPTTDDGPAAVASDDDHDLGAEDDDEWSALVAAGARPEHPTDHSADGMVPGATPRRRFLVGTAGLAGGAALLGAVGQKLAAPEPVRDLPKIRPASPAPALPASLDAKVKGISTFRTPARSFYRVDTALVIPRVDVGRWKLQIDGMVDRPFELTYDELLDLPLIERDITLNCVSSEVGGPYISSGRWLGVRTRDLLERAGLRDGVDQILSRSVDGMTISTPIKALTDDRDAMVAVGLNGDTLPRRNGYPARLLTPGLYGYVGSTKWVTKLTATTYQKDRAYWTRRGWAIKAPVKTQSRIDTPASFARVPAGTVVVGGVAWAQGRGIEKVEVQVDEGEWREATLGAEANIDYWRQWYLPVELSKGRHDLVVRATDGDGKVQTEKRARPFPNGASGLHSVSIAAT